MRLYIAGASAEPERVRFWMERAKEFGFELTLDWLAVIEERGVANLGMEEGERAFYALADLSAVREADVFWLLAPGSPSTGAWVELGYALAHREHFPHDTELFVSGAGSARCIFASLADREFATDDAAFEHLCATSFEVQVGHVENVGYLPPTGEAQS